jgi:hypothetical protein
MPKAVAHAPVEIDRYIVDIRLVTAETPPTSDPKTGDSWVTLPTNLNPGGRRSYLYYRLSTDEKLALRDIRVLVQTKGESIHDRLPRGYTLLDFDLNLGVTNAPATFLCWTRTKESGKPIRAIQSIIVDGLPYLAPYGFTRVQGDFGGNINVNSKTHIYLAVSHTPPQP